MLDDLSQSMAQGWKGNPLRVYYDDAGRLVSLDNRRLTAAKIVGLDVPIEIVSRNDKTIANLIDKKRDGVFDFIRITSYRGSEEILETIDMLGGVLK